MSRNPQGFGRPISRPAGSSSGMDEIGVAAPLARFREAEAREDARHLGARDEGEFRHAATSIWWTPMKAFCLTGRFSSSARVRAWVWQPLRSGTMPT